MARRLVELGVPFIEVDFGGWDNHSDIFTTLEEKLPIMDQAMNALINELNERGLYEDVAIVWMGEFGRTPRINQDVGRDHWAASWSVMLGGGGGLARRGERVCRGRQDRLVGRLKVVVFARACRGAADAAYEIVVSIGEAPDANS